MHICLHKVFNMKELLLSCYYSECTLRNYFTWMSMSLYLGIILMILLTGMSTPVNHFLKRHKCNKYTYLSSQPKFTSPLRPLHLL